ncbi:MAG: hypothetical protein KTR32_26330, partial [Granulosicoccus sp.]|nr:hypothetical protein [Granulosicoccus sp.]
MKSWNWASIVSACRRKSARVLLTSVVVGVALAGCGGGSSDSGNPDESGPIIVGTGITDRTLARNVLDVKAGSGEKSMTAIASNGAFNGTIEGDGPFLSRIDLGNNEFLYGIGYPDADGRVQQNVHSYSDLIIRNWFSSMGRNIDNDFDSSASIALPTQADIDAITARVVGIVAQVMDDYNVGGADLLTGSATGNLNTFIIQNPVIIQNNNFTIVVRADDTDGTQSVATDELDLGTDLTAEDTENPTAPTDVRAIGASASEVVIVWTPSTDNVGVAGYRVFRQGVDIGETPYPVFTDSTIGAGVTPLYTVVAVDSSGNLSLASTEVAGMTLGTPDTIAPPTPQGVTLDASINAVSISWQQSAIDDVAGFQVFGAVEGQPVELLATVTSTFMIDTTVASGTSYCYQIVAVDASSNASDPTDLLCATTSGTAINTDTTPPVSSDVEVAFATASYSVTEDSTSAELKVRRIGASTSAVSVSYTVTSGTAIDGEDFTATSGTLQWAAGDTADKTISVQIAADADSTEGNETFTVTLSEVSSNATLGSIAMATVTIADSEAVVCDTVLETTRIEENTTLNLSCYLVNDDLDVRQPAKLTISAGTTLKFASGKQLIVREGGSLSANGTAANKIVFTAQDPTPGFWDGIYFFGSNSSSNVLNHAIVEYGGGAGVANLRVANSRVSVANTVLRHSEEFGFTVDAQSTVTNFSDVVVTANKAAGSIAPVQAGSIDESATFTGNQSDVVEVLSSILDE